MDLIRNYDLRNFYWIDAYGRSMPIYDINDKHLLNILNKFYRDGDFCPSDGPQSFETLYEEALERGLNPRYKLITTKNRMHMLKMQKIHQKILHAY